MTNGNDHEDSAHDIKIVQCFDAPRDLVFRNWVNPADVASWFAPDNCSVTTCEVDARPKGQWRVEYRHEVGGKYIEYGQFYEVVEPERLVFSLTQEDGEGNAGPRTLIAVRFAEVGDKTEMTFHQTGFDTAGRRDDHIEGWSECFSKLASHMAKLARGR